MGHKVPLNGGLWFSSENVLGNNAALQQLEGNQNAEKTKGNRRSRKFSEAETSAPSGGGEGERVTRAAVLCGCPD